MLIEVIRNQIRPGVHCDDAQVGTAPGQGGQPTWTTRARADATGAHRSLFVSTDRKVRGAAEVRVCEATHGHGKMDVTRMPHWERVSATRLCAAERSDKLSRGVTAP